MNEKIKELNKQAEIYSNQLEVLKEEISKVIVGQDSLIEMMLIAIASEGHVLLEGVPGLAKTMMVKTLSDSVEGDFSRIQFTPDLLPADIIGTTIYNQKTAEFNVEKGPIFANFVLADEINRAPPKVQSALLEAMQEKQISISKKTLSLPELFLVLATQNPIESEGTYVLPEAEIDRFMFKLFVDYPERNDEKEIVRRMCSPKTPVCKKVISIKKLQEIQKFTKTIYLDDSIIDYITKIVDVTRNPLNYKIDANMKDLIEYGASPRASIYLASGAKANALLCGRGYVIPEDVCEIAYAVLRHRIILSYEAEAEEIKTDDLIEKILNSIKVP
ncbi:MAG: MoxR family ATPase [Candidatus Aenigmarchaeota archaeon]|nr:MoxR family ATPase [Candidatus Aenigmarchaeota archaeon]